MRTAITVKEEPKSVTSLYRDPYFWETERCNLHFFGDAAKAVAPDLEALSGMVWELR